MTSLTTFLNLHKTTLAKKNESQITHTRIGNKENKIYGGSYSIKDEDEDKFYDLVYKEIIQNNHIEYLTEYQLKNNKIYVDLDFRYINEINKRPNTLNQEWIESIIGVYLDKIKQILIVEPNINIPVFVLQKSDVNQLQDGSYTKDGLHIIFGVKMPNKLQLKLRTLVMEDEITKEIMSQIPLINDFNGIFDEGLSKGTTNAQVYGCRKPHHEAYKLQYIFDCHVDSCDNEWCIPERKFSTITKEIFLDLSVRKGNPISFKLNESSKQLMNPLNELEKKKRSNNESIIFDEISDDDINILFSLLKSSRIDTSLTFFEIAWALINTFGIEKTKKLIPVLNSHCLPRNNEEDISYALEWVDKQEPKDITAEKRLTLSSIHYWAREDSPELYAITFKKHNKIMGLSEFKSPK